MFKTAGSGVHNNIFLSTLKKKKNHCYSALLHSRELYSAKFLNTLSIPGVQTALVCRGILNRKVGRGNCTVGCGWGNKSFDNIVLIKNHTGNSVIRRRRCRIYARKREYSRLIQPNRTLLISHI